MWLIRINHVTIIYVQKRLTILLLSRIIYFIVGNNCLSQFIHSFSMFWVRIVSIFIIIKIELQLYGFISMIYYLLVIKIKICLLWNKKDCYNYTEIDDSIIFSISMKGSPCGLKTVIILVLFENLTSFLNFTLKQYFFT